MSVILRDANSEVDFERMLFGLRGGVLTHRLSKDLAMFVVSTARFDDKHERVGIQNRRDVCKVRNRENGEMTSRWEAISLRLVERWIRRKRRLVFVALKERRRTGVGEGKIRLFVRRRVATRREIGIAIVGEGVDGVVRKRGENGCVGEIGGGPKD